jgi:cytochrome c-type biogenesis protein CcmE
MSRTPHVIAVMLVSLVCLTSVAQAADPVSISSLQAYPEAYKMKVVQVTGMVSGYQMHHFIGTSSKMEKCIQNFLVDDGSGTIQAGYTTLCGNGLKPVMLQDGDRVTIEGHYLGTLDVKAVRKN